MFWGHPFTSGISDTVDFYILPQGAEDVGGGGGELTDFRASTTSRYQEQLVRFDTLGAYYDRVSDPGPSSNQIPSMYGPWRWVETFEHRRQVLTAATQEDAVTFLDGSLVDVFGSHGHVLDATLYACPQHCGKFHPLFDQALIRILQVDSAAVLLLRDCGVADLGLTEINQGNKDTKEVTPSFATRLLEREDGLSLASRILVIRHQLPLSSFLRLLGSAHVALEPFPFPASITTLDAFTVTFLTVPKQNPWILLTPSIPSHCLHAGGDPSNCPRGCVAYSRNGSIISRSIPQDGGAPGDNSFVNDPNWGVLYCSKHE